jgi:hypothetical protein
MGESKRRKVHDTLDGGPLSGDRIALELCTFSPTPDALMSGDPHCLVTMRELFQRMHTRRSVLGALKLAKPEKYDKPKDRFTALVRAFNACDDDERDRFVFEILRAQ